MKHVFNILPNINPQNKTGNETQICLKCSGVRVGAISTLTTHCSGHLLTESLHSDILEKKIDYLNGLWIVNGIFTKRRSVIF